MPIIVAPVADWIKNMNDHAINGNLYSSSATSSAPGTTLSASPLVRSLAAGLRGDLRYPSPPPGTPQPPENPRGVDFLRAVEVVALSPPPRSAPAAAAKRQTLARMRGEMLGDRKLRIARFLLEAASVTGGYGAGSAASISSGGAGGGGRGGHTVFVSRTRRLLLLLAETFRRRDSPRGADEGPTRAAGPARDGDPGAWSPLPLPPPPRLELRRDIAALIRPVYALLAQALLGEPGPARRLARQGLLAAAALSTAGLDATLSSSEGGAVEGAGMGGGAGASLERRAAVCFAEAVVLVLSAKLETFLGAVGADGAGGAGDGRAGQGGGEGTLADLGRREVELESLLRELGAWDIHGAARGWPHSTPAVVEQGAGEGGDGEEPDTSLPTLVAGAEDVVEAFRSGGDGEGDCPWWRRVGPVLVGRIESCRALWSTQDAL